MGFFDKFKEKKKVQVLTNNFKLLNGYNTVFTSYSGGLYEMELTRAAINAIATQCSKLNPVIVANNKYRKLDAILKTKPNYIMTTQQFLSKLITILICENNAYIIPIYENEFSDKIIGFYPIRASGSIIVSDENINYLKYQLENKEYVIEYEKVGHLKRHYYRKEFFGENNDSVKPTLDLMYTQNQGITNGIKNSANIRFIAKLANILNPKDIQVEKEKFAEANLSIENNSGVMLVDNKYSSIEKIESKPFIIDDKQIQHIKNNVYDYFHVSESIIQNKANEDEWNSFYEGCIEPIAIQIGQVLTSMIFSKEEIEKGYEVILESSKLQFASNKTKLEVSSQLFDRGVLTINQIMNIWNLPKVEDGDNRYIRKEYTEVNNLDKNLVEGGEKNE